MAFPAENSAVEQVCKYLAEAGQATASEVKKATGLSVNTTARAYELGFLTRYAGMNTNAAYVYEVTPKIREFLAFGGERYQGTIVPPRIVNVLNTKPLEGYTASLTANLREPIRDMSFFRTFASALPRQ